MIQWLLDEGVPVDNPQYPLSPLYAAIMGNSLESVHLLIEKGAGKN